MVGHANEGIRAERDDAAQFLRGARVGVLDDDYEIVGQCWVWSAQVASAVKGLGNLSKLGRYSDEIAGAVRKARVCSFTAGTVVRMCDGSYQPIETVQAGQWVLARDASTGELACKEVVDPYANPDRSIIVLELQAEDGTIEAIETTDNHPFFVADRGWTRVDELSIGDLIPSADGTMLTLVSALWTHRIETVYNFGVEGFHTYFIGESEAWVHNCFYNDKELLKRMKWQDLHREKKALLREARKEGELDGWNVKNPDIGITTDGNLIFRDPRNHSNTRTSTLKAEWFYGE